MAVSFKELTNKASRQIAGKNARADATIFINRGSPKGECNTGPPPFRATEIRHVRFTKNGSNTDQFLCKNHVLE